MTHHLNQASEAGQSPTRTRAPSAPAPAHAAAANAGRTLALPAAVICGLLPAWSGAALDWPQFRGPRGDGSAPEAEPPLVWSETTNVAWRIAVTGRGRSSPVLLGERIWLTTALEQGVVRKRIGPDDMQAASHVSLHAVCLDRASGQRLWEVQLFDVPQPDPVHWLNSWATPTPVVEPGRVYCDFGTFGTACLDAATGKVIWQRQFKLDHQVGPGSSPILWRDRLVLVRDGRDAQYVTALDKLTGKTLWKTDRPPIQTGSPNLKKSFSTPLAIGQGEQAQLVAPGAHWTVAYEPSSGAEIWRVRHGDGFSIGTSPVSGHGLVYFGTGCFKAQLWAVRTDGRADVTTTHTAWKTLRQVPVMSSPVLVGDDLFWVSDDGMASCADARSGEVQWQERLGGGCLASPIATKDRIYFFRQDAKTIVIRPGRTFERLAENSLEGTLIASPAVDRQALYVRTDTHLYCIRR
jgi:outer membrane protein assembly factor BamB